MATPTKRGGSKAELPGGKTWHKASKRKRRSGCTEPDLGELTRNLSHLDLNTHPLPPIEQSPASEQVRTTEVLPPILYPAPHHPFPSSYNTPKSKPYS